MKRSALRKLHVVLGRKAGPLALDRSVLDRSTGDGDRVVLRQVEREVRLRVELVAWRRVVPVVLVNGERVVLLRLRLVRRARLRNEREALPQVERVIRLWG